MTNKPKFFVPSGRLPYDIIAQLADRACKKSGNSPQLQQLQQLIDAWPRVSWEDVAKVMRSR